MTRLFKHITDFLNRKVSGSFIYFESILKRVFMTDNFLQGDDLASLIWQIHERFSYNSPQELKLRLSQIQNVLFRLKHASPNETSALDDPYFYWGMDGMESDKVTQTLGYMQSGGLIAIDKEGKFIDSTFNQKNTFLRKQNEPLNFILDAFFNDECEFINEIFDIARYPFMRTFRMGFISKLGAYFRNPEVKRNLNYDNECLAESPYELKRAIYKAEVEFPTELNLFELDDLLSQYVTNTVWLLDYYMKHGQYLNPMESSDLLKEIFELGYKGIWHTFLLGYRHTYGVSPEPTNDELEEWGKQYKKCVNDLVDSCQTLESKILHVVREYLPTELTKEQRETLASFNKY